MQIVKQPRKKRKDTSILSLFRLEAMPRTKWLISFDTKHFLQATVIENTFRSILFGYSVEELVMTRRVYFDVQDFKIIKRESNSKFFYEFYYGDQLTLTATVKENN
jgi:hypothetical protein